MSNGATARTRKALFRTVCYLIVTITLTVAGGEMVSRFSRAISFQSTVCGFLTFQLSPLT